MLGDRVIVLKECGKGPLQSLQELLEQFFLQLCRQHRYFRQLKYRLPHFVVYLSTVTFRHIFGLIAVLSPFQLGILRLF